MLVNIIPKDFNDDNVFGQYKNRTIMFSSNRSCILIGSNIHLFWLNDRNEQKIAIIKAASVATIFFIC